MSGAVTVDGTAAIKSLHALRGALDTAVFEATRDTVDAIALDAKATTAWRDRTGKTRKSIRSRTGGQTWRASGFVVAGGVAHWLEYGTRPHEIHARGGGMLRFEVGGTLLFRRMVHHPGTAPRPFMGPARDWGERMAPGIAAQYTERAIRSHP